MVAVLVVIGVVTVMAAGVSSAEPTSGESHFDVEITETNAPLAEGETFIVNATITNTGMETDSQQIHLKNFDKEIVDSVAGPPVTLAPGEQENVTLEWETGLGNRGSGEFSVQSNDAFPNQPMTIEKGAFFGVEINDTNLPSGDSERLNVTVNVTTPRETIETTRVRLELDGETKDDKRAVLLYGTEDQITFSIPDSDLTSGESTLTVATDGAQDSMRILIDEETKSVSFAAGSDETEAESATTPSATETDPPTTMSDSSADGESSDSAESRSSQEESQSPSMTESGPPSDSAIGGFSLGQLIAIVLLIGAGAGVIYSVRTN